MRSSMTDKVPLKIKINVGDLKEMALKCSKMYQTAAYDCLLPHTNNPVDTVSSYFDSHETATSMSDT